MPAPGQPKANGLHDVEQLRRRLAEVEAKHRDCDRLLRELEREVSQREQTEDVLRRSEEQFRRAFEGGPLALAIVDREGRFIQVNEAYVRLVGYGEDELRGRHVREVMHPDDASRVVRQGQRILGRQAGSFTTELRYVRKDGRIVWGRLTATAIRDQEGNTMYGLGMIEDITGCKRAEAETQRERQLLRQLLELHERERKVIAYEIHDGLAQQLTGALFTFQALGQLRNKETEEAQTMFAAGLQLLTEGVAETRRLISGLRPPVLDESGVVVGIEFLVADLLKFSSAKIRFTHNVAFKRLAFPLENALFRIAQEALTNATRYSHSDDIEVRLEQLDDRIVLSVQDWGIGFNPDEVGSQHFGVRGIRERARLLGGHADVESAPGQGTLVRVELPSIEAGNRDETEPVAAPRLPR